MTVGFLHNLVSPSHATQCTIWHKRGSHTETFKVVVIDTQRVLDQWLGWHIHWQARYYSSATVPQIVFQVNLPSHPRGIYVTLVRVGPSVCHQWRGSLPAVQEERGHRDLDLDLLPWEECEELKTDCQKMSHQTGINGKHIFEEDALEVGISCFQSTYFLFIPLYILSCATVNNTSSQSPGWYLLMVFIILKKIILTSLSFYVLWM